MQINPTLLQMARMKVANDATQVKSAVVPPPPPMDPAAAGGAGGAPPMDPAMMGGGAPPMDPAMMGGAPPMDPSMMGGAAAPPVDPAAAGAVPPAAPAAPGAVPQKVKPEDRMNQIDFRLYNMQQQLTAIMNALNVDLPAGALITPPGSPIPVAEAAVPGGPQAPAPNAAGGEAPPDASGIGAIDPMQAFNPAAGGGAAGGAGGGESKQAGIAELISSIVGRGVNQDAFTKAAADPAIATQPQPSQPSMVESRVTMYNQAAAAAALLRSRMRN